MLLYYFEDNPPFFGMQILVDGFEEISNYGRLSALIRDNKPGIAAFRLANGYGALRDALSSENVRFQR